MWPYWRWRANDKTNRLCGCISDVVQTILLLAALLIYCPSCKDDNSNHDWYVCFLIAFHISRSWLWKHFLYSCFKRHRLSILYSLSSWNGKWWWNRQLPAFHWREYPYGCHIFIQDWSWWLLNRWHSHNLSISFNLDCFPGLCYPNLDHIAELAYSNDGRYIWQSHSYQCSI